MSAQTKDGGPAFPLQSIGPEFTPGYAGMSLRDYFASQIIGHLCVSELRQEKSTQQDAAYAYAVADAMLAAREVRHD